MVEAFIPWSRKQNRTVITWALKELFEDDGFYTGTEDEVPDTFQGPMRRVLNNHQLINWNGITSLRAEDIDGLEYYHKDKDTVPTPIVLWQKSCLYQLVAFTRHMAAKGTPLETPASWMMVTNYQFWKYAVEEWDDSATSTTAPTNTSGF